MPKIDAEPIRIFTNGKYRYWRVRKRVNGNIVLKTFPHTDEGLKRAEKYLATETSNVITLPDGLNMAFF